MAPRSELLTYDSRCVEFKPRIGTWASYDAWSQSRLSLSEQSTSTFGEGQSMEDSFCSSSNDNNNASQHSRRRRLRVRFARNISETRDYIHRTEYLAEEKHACWHQRADYQAMKAHNAETIDKILRRILLDERDESHIGLEVRMSPTESLHCHYMMRHAILAVLDEQEDQWRFDNGHVDYEIIAARYSYYTWEAQDRALCLGYQHSLAV